MNLFSNPPSCSTGNIGPAILLIATGFVPCTSAYLAIGVLSLATGCIGFQFPGALVNHVDIAPPFAGVLFGISNTVATIPGFISPYVVKRLTVHVSFLNSSYYIILVLNE